MEIRGLFENIFGKKPQTMMGQAQFKLLNGYNPTFSAFGTDAYASDIVRSVINAIASNAAKLKPKHIRRIEGGISPQGSNIERLLQIKPNEYMNAYDFYYKVVTQLYMKNNAFIFIMKDDFGGVVGFYPVNASSVELVEYMGEIFCKFRFMGGRMVTLPYKEIIHLRRFFNENDMYGSDNNALYPTLELINTTNQGIINAIKSSAQLRGLLKFSQAMMKEEDIKKQKDRFVTDYLSIENQGGVAALDAKAEYQELKSDPKSINGPQMDLIEQKVFKYFNVNKSIVTSDYSEDQWNAFYESVIEPIAIQLSLEFTSKLFSDRELGFGNEIIFEANRLQYASIGSKISIVQILTPIGMLTTNEGREIFNLGKVEDGDKRLMSLNYVDATKANKYQVNENDAAGGAADKKTEEVKPNASEDNPE